MSEKEKGFRERERTCTERTLARIHTETRIDDDDYWSLCQDLDLWVRKSHAGVIEGDTER